MIIAFAVCGVFSLSGQGIEFFHGTWEEAKEKASEEEKLIFVDAFAKWCGPCKRMAKNVFTNPSVGEFFNANFISMKIDMEEGMGLSFGRDYPVSAYPTLFFMDEDGEVLKKQVGAMQAKELIQLAQMIVRNFDRSGDYALLYEEGNRDYDLVLNYIKSLNRASKPSLKITNEYLRTAQDLTPDQRAEIVYEGLTHADSRLFDLFIEEKKILESIKGETAVQEKIRAACWNTVYNAIDFESDDLLEEAVKKMEKYGEGKDSHFAVEARYECAKALADAETMVSSAKVLADKKYALKADELNQLAEELELYRNIHPDILGTAEDIARMSVEVEDSPAFMLTYARLLSLNGKPQKAKKVAERAKVKAVMDPRMSREIEDLLEILKEG
jgi:thiol-disulfide isomerase/thioredoxin